MQWNFEMRAGKPLSHILATLLPGVHNNKVTLYAVGEMVVKLPLHSTNGVVCTQETQEVHTCT